MKMKFLVFAVFFIFSLTSVFSLSFKLGGLMGLDSDFKDNYKNVPIAYVEHTLLKNKDWDLRTSLGFTYLDSTNYLYSTEYGYTGADTSDIYNLYSTPQVGVGSDSLVKGPVNESRKLLLIPLKLQANRYVKIVLRKTEFETKKIELAFTGGFGVYYYKEKSKNKVDSNNVIFNDFYDKDESGFEFGLNAGIGVKFSKKVSFHTEYNWLNRTKLDSKLHNLELYFRVDY